MIDVTEYFNLHVSTTHAAIAYLDRLQPNEQFSRFEWQMLAICCILISAKFHECEEHVPALRKLEDITQQSISNDCVLSYELWALKKMSWKLNVRTPVAFLSSYMKLGYVHHTLDAAGMDAEEKEDLNRSMVSLATKCIINTAFKAIPASAVAAAIAFYARRSAGVVPAWTASMSKVMYHDPCRDAMGLKALELLYAMDDDVAGFEELLLTVQDATRSTVARDGLHTLDKENSFYDDEDVDHDEDSDENEVRTMCTKLQNMLTEIQSPAPTSKALQEEPSPTSVANLVL